MRNLIRQKHKIVKYFGLQEVLSELIFNPSDSGSEKSRLVPSQSNLKMNHLS